LSAAAKMAISAIDSIQNQLRFTLYADWHRLKPYPGLRASTTCWTRQNQPQGFPESRSLTTRKCLSFEAWQPENLDISTHMMPKLADSPILRSFMCPDFDPYAIRKSPIFDSALRSNLRFSICEAATVWILTLPRFNSPQLDHTKNLIESSELSWPSGLSVGSRPCLTWIRTTRWEGRLMHSD
jgi:hypothetical protein